MLEHIQIWDLEIKDFLPYFCSAIQHVDSMDRLNSWDTKLHWGVLFSVINSGGKQGQYGAWRYTENVYECIPILGVCACDISVSLAKSQKKVSADE